MNSFSPSDFDSSDSAGWWLLLLLKSCIVLIGALGLDQLLKKRINAAARHTVLVCGYVGLVAILVGSFVAETTRWKITLPIFESGEEAKAPSSVTISSSPMVHNASDSDHARQTIKNTVPGAKPAFTHKNTKQSETAGISTDSKTPFNSPSVRISIIWLFGSAFSLTFHMIAYAMTIRRVLRDSSDADKSLSKELIHLRRDMNLSRSIRLRLSKIRTAPLLFGTISPTVIVPENFRSLEAKDRRMILAHELQHIRRNDVAVRHFVRMVSSLFWFSPFVWFVSRKVKHLQELACDDAVLKSTKESATDYADLLVHIARTSIEPYHRSGISMAGNSKLPARIDAILAQRKFPTRSRPILRFTLLFLCSGSLFAGLAQITQADAKLESKSNSPTSAKLTKRERQHIAEIYNMFERSREFPSGLFYKGSVSKSEWRDSREKLETHPIETEFSVWLKGDWDSPKYRVDFTPNVSMWVSGAAPWSIQNETHYSDPRGTKKSIMHSDIGRRTPNPYRTGIENLPGIFAILSTANRDDIEATLEEGRRNSLFYEIEARLNSGERLNGITAMKLVENGEIFPGETVVELNLSREGRSEVWWFDSKRDYAVRGWIREDTTAKAPRFRNRLRVSNLVSLGGKRWFPAHAEASLERNVRGGDSMHYYWRSVYQFDSVQILNRIDDSTFTLEGIGAYVGNHPSSSSSADEKIVGGIIVNEEGHAVEGVEVDLSVSISAGRRKSFLAETGKNGKWSTVLTEPHLDEFYVRLSHPDYVTDRYTQDFRERASQPYSALYDRTSKVIIKRGITFSGKVIDYKADPVANAEVVMVRDRWGANIPDVRTDSDGRFRMPAFDPDKLASSQVYLTVQAKNHGPALRILSPESLGTNAPIVVALPPPSSLQLRIIDDSGKPIKGALVVADSWREQTRTLVFEQRTNSDGIVQWSNAPNSVVSFDILGRDVTLRDCSVEPSEKPVDIVLRPAFTIQGRNAAKVLICSN